MKNRFDKKQSESLPSVNIQNRGLELSPRQAEIYRNLEAIGPEIAAFYLDGVRTLQNSELETTPYLLAHIAREIEGGLRDVLSSKQGKQRIQKRLRKEELGDLKDRIGHIASILAALGVDDLHAPIANKWIDVATRFHQFAHRHGVWETPRGKEAFVPLWNEFEEVLAELVGNYFNLLSRLDRILEYTDPTEEAIKTLPNLLLYEPRRAYFFKKLESPTWLKPLKDAGWFNPESMPPIHEIIDQPEHYTTSPWYALEYLEKIVKYIQEHPCDEIIDTLAEIVSETVTFIDNNQKQIMHSSTVWQLVKIIGGLPIEQLKRQHITFMSYALQCGPPLLVEREICQTLLPKLLNAEAKELTLVLLEVILNDYRMIFEMENEGVIEKQDAAIVKLCGIEVVHIVLKQIQKMINQGTSSFEMLQPIDSNSPEDFPQSYSELLISFICRLFRLAEPESIAETVEGLLQKSHTIFKQIALNIIKYHYSGLKQIFWEWEGNPLEETFLKPELYQLIQANCLVFDEGEIDQILHWVESQRDIEGINDDDSAKQIAYRKREWLSALSETENKKVESASQKYEQINSREIEHPGLLIWTWTQTWSGDTSPVTAKELSNKSNTEIARFLNGFKEKAPLGPTVPTEEGLREILEECVVTNPKKFTHDLHPFYSVSFQYQSSLIQGFRKAWKDKKEFNWSQLLDFVYNILSSEQFWTEPNGGRFNYRNWTLSAIADLVAVGTQDDDHAFNVELLPLAEKILLILIEKVGDQQPVITIKGNSEYVNLPSTFLNTAKGRMFSATMNYALRFARINDSEQDCRWPEPIREEITKRLDRSIEPSLVFSFALGAYLANLLYLEKAWVDKNIDRIFLQQDESHWHAAFSGYLFYSRQVNKTLYFLLKEHKHYQKSLHTDFSDEGEAHKEFESLVAHICIGWIEDWEKLDDETSLIYQLINKGKPNHLSALVHFFWRQRDKLPEEMKAKVRPAWQAMFEVLSEKKDIAEYQEVLSRLSGWVALVDELDAEVLKWLKLSVRYIKGFSDSTFFIEDLLPHVSKTPAEVGEIYLEMLFHNVYPIHDQEHIQEIVRILYNTRHKEVADRICNLYGEAGFDFLRSLYDENQN